MKIFVRAIVTGFGLSIGAALFKKVQARLGLDDEKSDDKRDAAADVTTRDGATDPGLRHEFS